MLGGVSNIRCPLRRPGATTNCKTRPNQEGGQNVTSTWTRHGCNDGVRAMSCITVSTVYELFSLKE